jgi:hypothetical protein
MTSTVRGPYSLVPIVAMSISGISAILYEVRLLETSNILFVTPSGAGAPFPRLYLIPKSSSGPMHC